jgi:FkbM family methyltransferase
LNRVSRALSLRLTELVFKTESGPLLALLRAVFRFKRRIVSTERGKFYIAPFSHFGYFMLRDGDYEPALLSFLESSIDRGSVVIDVGAHEGYFSVVAAQLVGKEGQVVAIEPQTRVLPILGYNLRLNGLDNVHVVECAVSDRAAVGSLYLDPGHNTGGTGLTNMSRYRRSTQQVPTRRLADILRDCGIDHVDLVKMDIEGYEYEAILGSPELFASQRVETLALELHGTQMRARGRNPEAIQAFLLDSGYVLDLTNSYNLDKPYASMVFRVQRDSPPEPYTT